MQSIGLFLSILSYRFDIVSFFKPIAPKRPSPHPSDTFDVDFRCLARVNSGSFAFEFDSSSVKPQIINKAQIITNFDSVFNLQ